MSVYGNSIKTSYIFSDFAKAFETVSHSKLLSNLEYYGSIGLPLSFIKILSNRQNSKSQISKCISNPQTITCGVPRGSALGPLLFLLYINDIYLSSPVVTFHPFADDTCIFHSHPNISTLETELNITLHKVTNWLRANKLTINVSKSNLSLFNVGSKPQNKQKQK